MSHVIEKAWPNGELLGAARVDAAALDVGADEASAAAEVAMGRGRGEEDGVVRKGVGVAFSRFLADSWRRVLTTFESAQFWRGINELTPDWICTGSGTYTSDNSRTEMDQRTILCRLTWLLCRCVWELRGKVGL